MTQVHFGRISKHWAKHLGDLIRETSARNREDGIREEEASAREFSTRTQGMSPYEASETYKALPAERRAKLGSRFSYLGTEFKPTTEETNRRAISGYQQKLIETPDDQLELEPWLAKQSLFGVKPSKELIRTYLLKRMPPEQADRVLQVQFGLLPDADTTTRAEAQKTIATQNNETRRYIASHTNQTRRDVATQTNQTRRDIAGSKPAPAAKLPKLSDDPGWADVNKRATETAALLKRAMQTAASSKDAATRKAAALDAAELKKALARIQKERAGYAQQFKARQVETVKQSKRPSSSQQPGGLDDLLIDGQPLSPEERAILESILRGGGGQ